MIDDMGIFRTTVGVASWANPSSRTDIPNVMVDTGSEYNWIPEALLAQLGVAPVRVDRFETADGRILERSVGFAMLYAGGRAAPSIVVFAGLGDLVLLGAHGLEGLNLRVDLGRKELVPAGPVPAAAAAWRTGSRERSEGSRSSEQVPRSEMGRLRAFEAGAAAHSSWAHALRYLQRALAGGRRDPIPRRQ